jgi:hypothetical protein
MLSTTAMRRERAPVHLHELARPLRTLSCCLLCGFREVRTDEVLEHGVLILAECPRCRHRWTERPLPVAVLGGNTASVEAAA